MNEVIKKEMPLERVLNNLNKMRLSKEEIKTLMLPWIKLEIQRMKMK